MIKRQWMLLVLVLAAPLVNYGQHTEYAGVFAPSRMFVQEGEKPYRDDICLDGLWQFEPLSLPTGFKEGVDPAPELAGIDQAGWDRTPIRIPSPWNVNSFADRNGQGGDFRCYPSYPAAWEKCKLGWLRKKFFVPRGWEGRRIQLHFEAVAGDVQVVVNGKPVGTHFGIFLPFDIDITDAVRPGGDNELCVGVRKASLFDHRGNYGRRNYQAGSFWGQHIAGIWQDVFVVALPDVHVANVFVQPRVDVDTLQAEVSLVNHRDRETTVTVDAVAAGLTLPARVVRVPARGEAKVVLSAVVKGRLKYWSTEAPNLYNLIATVHEKGRAVDARSTRFGWRQVSLQGNQVLLNGKPIVMRGDSWHFLGIPQMSRRYAEAWYRAMRDAGLNAVRLHAQPYPSFYLDVADEMGILVLDESAMWASDGGPKLDDPLYWQDSKQHLTELILRDRNHPSIFGWSVSNEIMPVVRNVFHDPPGMADTLLKYDEEWATICRRLDPTRTWISADGEEDGQGRFPVYLVHYGGMDAMNRAQKSGKPWGVGEAGNAYYGTPEQVAQTNGMRAYESFEGRMEGVAASSCRSLMAQKERNAVYQSVFNMVWYGLRPLPLGMKDTTRPPRLEDGVYFTHFKEGEPGVQPERLGPYCTTLNPGYDPALPMYRTWPLFDAIRDAATGANSARWMADTPVVKRQPVAHSGQSGEVVFIDGVRGLGEIDKVTAHGGMAVVWGVRPEMLTQLNKLLPARLELYPRKASSLLPVGQDSITAGITAADMYFSEMRPPEIVDYTLGGPLVDSSLVLLQACGTDWLKWNKQPEYAKTAMVLRSQLETKPPGAVLVVLSLGRGRLVMSTLPVAPRVDKAAKAVRMLLGNLGVHLNECSVMGKPLLPNGELSLNGASEFWVLSPRSLDDLLSEPNIPVVNLEEESSGEVWLNEALVAKGKGVTRALRLHQGWNHFVVKGSFKGRFTCNQPDFLKELDSAYDRP
ncbi:glycoside hydrolase family 2 protein [Puia dinghuensis]|uniref:Beta-galactosidase n=1 Tax=Puia dinghuensis TaxID=1792502 RepID=A0A8J2XTU4_9BACT|nr:sugar-binding domain-containing protein [Puia dinghuensis]GGB02280.1 beta-galactosidase [Puia dinghuensis]